MGDNDWDTVPLVLRKRQTKPGQARSQQAVNAAQRRGLQIDTSKKFNAASNRQHQASKNTAKLDRETEELHHEKVGLSVSKLIQQARQELNLTQKDLATRINEKQQVINDYEAGRAVPNQQIITKLERALKIKLRGKEKGQKLEPRSSK